MSKFEELDRARKQIQKELHGKTLLRVDYSALKQDLTYYDNARFFLSSGWYRDEPFHCIDCGKLEIWTAEQQKWWYEEAKGSVLTIANRCLKCRKKHREEKGRTSRHEKA